MRSMIMRVAVTGLFLACASTTAQTGTTRGPRNVLTQEQLVTTNKTSLYEAIERLRPEWLSSRGPASATNLEPAVASVYMNGTMLGKAEYLREMRVLDVTEVRYWDAGQASARFGMGHPRGVIEILRK